MFAVVNSEVDLVLFAVCVALVFALAWAQRNGRRINVNRAQRVRNLTRYLELLRDGGTHESAVRDLIIGREPSYNESVLNTEILQFENSLYAVHEAAKFANWKLPFSDKWKNNTVWYMKRNPEITQADAVKQVVSDYATSVLSATAQGA